MSTRTLARLIFSSSKYCRHRKCNSFKNCVELLPGFRDCHFDGSVSSNVRYVTSAVTEHIVRQSRGLVECSVLKWLKLTQFHLFTPLFDWKKQLCNGKTSLEAVNIYFCAFRNWKCYTITVGLPWKFLNFDGDLQRCPSITQANSQTCFKWMSKCVI